MPKDCFDVFCRRNEVVYMTEGKRRKTMKKQPNGATVLKPSYDKSINTIKAVVHGFRQPF